MNKKKPIVGISANVMSVNDFRFKNYMKSYVNEDYVTSVVKAGGIPLIIPVIDDEEAIKAQVQMLDAIVSSGGDADVNPKLYGEKIQPKCTKPNDRRDNFDLKLIKYVSEFKKPILNVCRGHQIFNVSLGGSIYQDLSYYEREHLIHNQNSKPDFLAHKVKIKRDTILYDILKKDEVMVNSFHHQSIKDVAPSLKVTAVSDDDIVEAVEYIDNEYFMLSIQWHPEMLAARDNEDMLKIFKRLIEETKK